MSTDLPKRLESLESQVWELRTEHAEHRPVGEVVKYLLYFWLTLSVVLGVFGWTQVSDLDSKIDASVLRTLPAGSKKYKEYADLIDSTKALYGDFERLTVEYKQRVEDLKYADLVAEDFDIEGQVNRMIIESDFPGQVLDEEWRARAINTLNRLKATIQQRIFPADFVFNAAQVARQLQQFQLAADMTAAAYEKAESPPIRALKLSSEASNTVGREQEKAFIELMGMVESLDYQSSPHIVMAEAWNASERTRNYLPLLDAIESLEAGGSPVPSYVFAIRAQALMRLSRPGDTEQASEVLKKGYDRFQQESPMSQWNDAFEREYRSIQSALAEDRTIEVRAVDHGGGEPSMDLNALFRALQGEQEPGGEVTRDLD